MDSVRFLFGTLILLSVLFSLLLRPRIRPYESVFFISFVLFFVFIPYMTLVLDDYSYGIREKVFDENVYYIYIYNVFAIFCTFFALKAIFNIKVNSISFHRPLPESFPTFYIVPFIGAIFVYIGLGMDWSELMVVSRFGWFASESFNPVLLNVGFYFLVFGAIPVALLSLKGNRHVILKALLLLNYVAVMWITMGRKWIVVYFSGALVAAILKLKKDKKDKGKSKIIFFSLLVLLIVLLLQFFRRFSSDIPFDELWYLFQDSFIDLLSRGEVSYFYRASLESIRMQYEDGLIYPLHMIRTILFIFIPDEYTYGLKLPSIEFLIGDHLGLGGIWRNANQPAGLIGYFVLSFSYTLSGYIIGATFFFLTKYLDRLYQGVQSYKSILIQASSIYVWVLLLRGSSSSLYHIIFNLVFGLLLWIFVINFFKKKLTKSKE
jgi:hypothetical protein